VRRELIVLSVGVALAGIVPGEDTRETRLYVRTIPPGAKVVLDGKELGVSDCLLIVLPGDHSVTLEMEGYNDQNHGVRVTAKQITRLVVTLKKKEPPHRSGQVLPEGGRAGGPTTTMAPARATVSREQADAAREIGIEPAIDVALGPEESMEMVLVPAGRFVMGSPTTEKGRDGDERQHAVTITQPFYLGVHEVTRRQFDRFARDTGFQTDAEKKGGCHLLRGRMYEYVEGASWRMPGFSQTKDHPIVCVSWNDAVAFCGWLTRKTGVSFRLPTEAEWEYACRAGTTTAYQWGDDPSGGRGWCNGGDRTLKSTPGFAEADTFSWSDGRLNTAAVGSFKPNAWGLYDMHGNVMEWCSDWYAQYPREEQVNPTGGAKGTIRVLRGGCWNGEPRILRSADRYNHRTQGHSDSYIGFRCARPATVLTRSPTTAPR